MIYETVVSFLVDSIGALGYVGIFVLMFLESSFFPFPSEIIMIPAGYLAYQGKMNLVLIIGIGILGSVAGAWLNYFLADRFGRKLLLKFLKEHHLKMVEDFFEKHGHISTFNGRLIPVIRQYISFPAGLAKMNPLKFTLYTGLGAGIWITILAFLGYFLGQNEALIYEYLKEVTIFVLVFVLILTIGYIYFKKYLCGSRVGKN
ncbi:DedA family protein [Candidatus Pacearchaeota archaeon]|nr:DedA family protein [Candidatus Pacearchaeota archaeon]